MTDATRRLVLFVDIDGVLAPSETDRLERSCVERLDRLAAELDATIVITSTWRERHDVAELERLLHAVGLTRPVDGVTPILLGSSRGDEIGAYLAATGPGTRFVIIDDEADMDVSLVRDHLVRVDDWVGLQDVDLRHARDLARRQT